MITARIISVLEAAVVTVMVAILFYDDICGIIPGIVAGVYAYRCRMGALLRRQKLHRREQFKDMIIGVQSALEAGNSIERAFSCAANDMLALYGPRHEMVKEIRAMERRMNLGCSFEESLMELARSLDIDEIYDFAEVISTIKKTGGNAIRVIRDTSEKIVEEIELEQELEVIVASKNLEQQIMILMPSFIIIFLKVTSPGFLDPLYHNPAGWILMSVALLINLYADRLGKKIVDIKK